MLKGRFRFNQYLIRGASTITREYALGAVARFSQTNLAVVRIRERRAITFEEHQKIIERELNPATRAYYELLWHLGGAQTDIATLTAEDIDWKAPPSPIAATRPAWCP